MKLPKNLSGQKFGRLLALNPIKRNKITYWQCQCDCGNTFYVRGCSLESKNNRSCGCLSIERKKRKGASSNTWKGYGELPHNNFNTLKSGAKKRNLPFKITIQDAWNLFLKQNRTCALTGRILKFGSRKLKEDITASLDRIDSSKGYIKGNIQWVHKDVNRMKQEFLQSDFIKTCQEIVDFYLAKTHG